MNSILLGGAGFIGTNLAVELSKDKNNYITVADKDSGFFKDLIDLDLPNTKFEVSDLEVDTDYDSLVKGQDVVYHLMSTTVPTTSNMQIPTELTANVVLSANLFDACVRQNVKKLVFISSGGTVYGKDLKCPISEDSPTNPITSYGIQKLTIEKLLYLYNYLYNLDYRVVRLSNPYGPYQRPNGILGVVTTFTYEALKGSDIQVYGDGSVVRDFIYIDDAIKGIMNIVSSNCTECVFNLGCGYGTSVNQVIEAVKNVTGKDVTVRYTPSRKVDVPINYLNIDRYEATFGKFETIGIQQGIAKTAEFLKENYNL